MKTSVVIYEQIIHSDTDFSVKNRHELFKLTAQRKIKCKFTKPDPGNIIELSIGEKVKHLLVVKVNDDSNSTEIFVREVASGGLGNNDQLEINLNGGK
jgi:hypothetical protein